MEKTGWVKVYSTLNESLVNPEMLIFFENKCGEGGWGKFFIMKSTSLPNDEKLLFLFSCIGTFVIAKESKRAKLGKHKRRF